MTQAKPRSRKTPGTPVGTDASAEASPSGAAAGMSRPTTKAKAAPATAPTTPEGAPAPTGTARPAKESAAQTSRPTKAARLQEMLAAPGGATLAGLGAALGWQAHTVRAALTRLRQAGHAVERSKSEAGDTVYRIAPAATASTAEDGVGAGLAPEARPGQPDGPADAAGPVAPADAAPAARDGDAA